MNETYSNLLKQEFPYLDPSNSGEWAYGNCGGDNWFWEVPDGWRELFIDMCRELNNCLDKNNVPRTDLKVHQVKEKFGDLRFYFESPKNVNKELYDITEKYSDKSYHTCIDCGKPAVYISKGWISPYCKDCIGNRKYSLIDYEV